MSFRVWTRRFSVSRAVLHSIPPFDSPAHTRASVCWIQIEHGATASAALTITARAVVCSQPRGDETVQVATPPLEPPQKMESVLAAQLWPGSPSSVVFPY